MYKVVTRTERFDTEDEARLEAYSAIHNNPLCTILNERKEKISDKTFESDGSGTQHDTIILVVTWNEKVIS